MLGTGRTEIVALVAAYVVAVLATPAGISGAVLLLPFQVSVLGTPSPAVTPTNLLYNVVATPGGALSVLGRSNRPADASPGGPSPSARPGSSPDRSSAWSCCPARALRPGGRRRRWPPLASGSR